MVLPAANFTNFFFLKHLHIPYSKFLIIMNIPDENGVFVNIIVIRTNMPMFMTYLPQFNTHLEISYHRFLFSVSPLIKELTDERDI